MIKVYAEKGVIIIDDDGRDFTYYEHCYYCGYTYKEEIYKAFAWEGYSFHIGYTRCHKCGRTFEMQVARKA